MRQQGAAKSRLTMMDEDRPRRRLRFRWPQAKDTRARTRLYFVSFVAVVLLPVFVYVCMVVVVLVLAAHAQEGASPERRKRQAWGRALVERDNTSYNKAKPTTTRHGEAAVTCFCVFVHGGCA